MAVFFLIGCYTNITQQHERLTTVATAKKTRSPSGLQARKSQSTRKAILKATLQCFVKYGYHNTTDLKISELSGLSRGAMRHHYPSRKAIIRDAIDYLHERRLNAFKNSLTDLDLHPQDRVQFAIDSYDELNRKPMFMAFSELSIAARRDSELADVLHKKQKSFEKEYMRMGVELFPEWENKPVAYDVVMHLTRYILEGMANDLNPPDPTIRRLLIEQLEAKIQSLIAQPKDLK